MAEDPTALTAGAVDLVSAAELEARLEEGRPLRVKLGIDPTAPDLHLGFAVVLDRLRAFQDRGHVAVLIIGDYTARIGDPSGRSRTRPTLGPDEIEANARTYLDQAALVLDTAPARLEVRRNSEWLEGMGADGIVRLAGAVTVAQLLERKDFAARYRDGTPISVRELLYPLLQAQDSVEVRADVELGGGDQLFNLLLGRDLQSQAGQDPQVVLTTPLLEGLDGVRKMSKSYGNSVGLTEAAAEQFGKLMSIPDELIGRYALLTTGWDRSDAEALVRSLEEADTSPLEAKRAVAAAVVDRYHGPGAGQAAEAAFDRVFRDHEAPEDVPEHVLDVGGDRRLAHVLADAGLVRSNKEGRRMIEAGAVRLDGERIDDPDHVVDGDDLDGRLAQVGRRRWIRFRQAPGPG